MVSLIVAILGILWILGYVSIPGFQLPNFVLFYFNKQAITLLNVLVLLVLVWVIQELGQPFRSIAVIALALWLLSILGIIAVPGLANLLVLAVVVGLVLYLFKK